ncbi:hypothetical protein [Massilia eurypsychrophila]|uniref:hypothetical protein n=1 Tax=Massilia eurypsychrophila TaxID=1485217 RepID=UPI0015D486C0|nr:hypothetical protein [Massilia eurypsychrophila]
MLIGLSVALRRKTIRRAESAAVSAVLQLAPGLAAWSLPPLRLGLAALPLPWFLG